MKRLWVLVLALLLTACNTVIHGRVVAKHDHPPYQTVIFMPMSCGKDCTTMVPIPIFYPESYSITVDGSDKKGKPAKDEIYLNQSDYEQIQVGDLYTCGQKNACVTERPQH